MIEVENDKRSLTQSVRLHDTCGPEEISQLLEVFDTAVIEHHFAPEERSSFIEFLQEGLSHAGLVVKSVVMVDGAVSGVVGVRHDESGVEGEWYLDWLLLATGARGRGIGTYIFKEHVFSIARGAAVLKLFVGASQLSESFFRRMGCEVLSREPNGWGEGLDRVSMVYCF